MAATGAKLFAARVCTYQQLCRWLNHGPEQYLSCGMRHGRAPQSTLSGVRNILEFSQRNLGDATSRRNPLHLLIIQGELYVAGQPTSSGLPSALFGFSILTVSHFVWCVEVFSAVFLSSLRRAAVVPLFVEHVSPVVAWTLKI